MMLVLVCLTAPTQNNNPTPTQTTRRIPKLQHSRAFTSLADGFKRHWGWLTITDSDWIDNFLPPLCFRKCRGLAASGAITLSAAIRTLAIPSDRSARCSIPSAKSERAWQVDDGASIYEAQQLLGHYSISMTERYARLFPNTLQERVDIIADSLDFYLIWIWTKGFEASCV